MRELDNNFTKYYIMSLSDSPSPSISSESSSSGSSLSSASSSHSKSSDMTHQQVIVPPSLNPEFEKYAPAFDKITEKIDYTFEQDSKNLAEMAAKATKENMGHIHEAASKGKMSELAELKKMKVYDTPCIRNRSNWANLKEHHKFDKPNFNPIKFDYDMDSNSPKLEALLKKIEELDKHDMEKYGRMFKHFIFSDLKNGHGAKIVTAGLLSKGFNLGYNINGKGEKKTLSLPSLDNLEKTAFRNFFLLSSVAVYNNPLKVAFKKEVLALFNSRPKNVYGKYGRIIVMDSGFKEGIDLFDIKYVHIFEPSMTGADQKQVIGRGTRTCGQKGLKFNPRIGWPLYVFKYDLSIDSPYNKIYQSNTTFEYLLNSMNIDVRMVNLAAEIEPLAIKGSVDYDLNKTVHGIDSTDVDGISVHGGGNYYAKHELEDEMGSLTSSKHGEKHRLFKKYVEVAYKQHAWPPVKMENLCGYEGPESMKGGDSGKSVYNNIHDYSEIDFGLQDLYDKTKNLLDNEPEKMIQSQHGGSSQLITLSPTQAFISEYFKPDLPVKGMVLWQSVGTGKTCTAIATATKQFEKNGYTILWVTRTTLKNDIWKNMFDQVCHEQIREKLVEGTRLPADKNARMRLLSKAWSIRPISYKQFTNLVAKTNMYYKQLIKKNGEYDPLRKTLLIIDEAHKLYGGGDLSSIERPDMKALHAALMKSYELSGSNSVRLMLMTATPITDSPLELVKLVNLCKPIHEQIPDDIERFSEKYLNEQGKFTMLGENMFLDDIAGHISYLNRENDSRQFARPILKTVHVPLVSPSLAKDVKLFDKDSIRRIMNSDIAEINKQLEVETEKMEKGYEKFVKTKNLSGIKEACDVFEDDAVHKKTCQKIAQQHIKSLVEDARMAVKTRKLNIKEIKESIKSIKTVSKNDLSVAKKIMSNPEMTEAYNKYKSTPYAALKDKCEQDLINKEPIYKIVNEHPTVVKMHKYESMLDTELDNLQMEASLAKKAMAQRIKEHRVFSRVGGLNELEKNTMEKIIKQETEMMKKEAEKTRRVIGMMKKYSESTRKLVRDKKNIISKMVKQVRKEELTSAKKTNSGVLKQEKNAKKELAKLNEAVLPNEIADLVKSHTDQLIEDTKKAVIENIKIKEDAKLIKQQKQLEQKAAKKEVKDAEKAKKTEEKLLAKEAEKARKAEEKLVAKEAEKARKEAAKIAEKTRKAMERLATKSTKGKTIRNK